MGRRQARARSKQSNNFIWTAVSLDADIPLASPFLQADIVSDSDWSVVGGQRGATVMAVRGWLSFTSIGTSASKCFYYLGTQDKDVTVGGSLDPLNVVTYVKEDIMLTGGWSKPVGAIDGACYHNIDINVKSKRRIKTGVELRLVLAASVVSEIHVIGIIRALLKMNN
jgi:hypothetical protein